MRPDLMALLLIMFGFGILSLGAACGFDRNRSALAFALMFVAICAFMVLMSVIPASAEQSA